MAQGMGEGRLGLQLDAPGSAEAPEQRDFPGAAFCFWHRPEVASWIYGMFLEGWLYP